MRARGVVVAVVLAAVLLIGWATRVAVTAPQRPTAAPALADIDPERLGATEQQAWAAYYYRDWPRLLQLMLDLLQGQFGLSPAQSVEAALLATRAQIAFAERGAQGGEAQALMRDFYALVREPSGGHYDPERAAALEVGWWVVHRERVHSADPAPLGAAVAALYAEVYGIPAAAAQAAGDHRAQAMVWSDQWIDEGKAADSPLLGAVREELVGGYRALRDALQANGTAP